MWIAAWLLAGCTASGTFADNVYRDSHTAFRVGDIPPAWQRFNLTGADLTFRCEGGGTVLVNSTCEAIKDRTLDVLTNQALFGVENKQVVGREPFTLDGRDALRTQVTGTMDGVPVELDLVVLKKDDCTYDLQLVASPAAYPSLDPAFQRFVGGFRQVARSGS